MGIGTEFEEGVFYQQPSLGFFYYCDRIEAGQAMMILIESYQNGGLLQAVIRMSLEHAENYLTVPCTSQDLPRLRRRLVRFKSKH